MRKIPIAPRAFLASPKERKFILLGGKITEDEQYVAETAMPKIQAAKTEQTHAIQAAGMWGTLGNQNDKSINWKGHVEISSEGNDGQFDLAVAEEIDLIKECFPELKVDASSIKERFISFEHLDIDFPDLFSLDQLPKLRLDLMVGPREGAVVFYQSDRHPTEDSIIEYIQPMPTKGHNTDERDRLSYHFDVIPQHALEELPEAPGFYRLSTEKRPETFLIKIIQFERKESSRSVLTEADNSNKQLRRVFDRLGSGSLGRLIARDHKLWWYNPEACDFEPANAQNVDPGKKTLLLIHGTFATTEGSFGDVYGSADSWLHKLSAKGTLALYEQIIAFEYPSVFNGAQENVAELQHMLSDVGIGAFEKTVDLIGTSQGGLLVQHLANLNQGQIRVSKAALIASANGVGYFSTLNGLSKILSLFKLVFKATGTGPLAAIAALAQHSVKKILDFPGFQVMTPGSESLKDIIDTTPYRKQTRYWPIAGDFGKGQFADGAENQLGRWLRRAAERPIDRAARAMLGERNDWVVGTRNQYLVPLAYSAIPGYHPGNYQEDMVTAIHGKAITKPKVQRALETFFQKQEEEPQEPQATGFFDAHCHIFGRNVISARILFLAIQDLISYFERRKSDDKLDPNELLKYFEAADAGGPGTVAKNILNFFLLNRDSFKMLEDLEDGYQALGAKIKRYVPLMFDLEMTFRNKYEEEQGVMNLRMSDTERAYVSKVNDFIKDISKIIDAVEKTNEMVFDGGLIANQESVAVLKTIRSIFSALNVVGTQLKKDTVGAYEKQRKELVVLKRRYGKNIYPFLAVDPRRPNMAQLVLDNVGPDKPFHGVKLYTPNGYSPTDPHLFDKSKAFIEGTSLYQWCMDKRIPIMAHNSSMGFATMARDLEVMGNVLYKGKMETYTTPTEISFDYHLLQKEGFKKSVRERAIVLNHPSIWKIVMKEYKDLKLCLAHFGGEDPEWREIIAELMENCDYLYTDLSCMVVKSRLEEIHDKYFKPKNPIIKKVMYGSDYFLNMLNKITFENYYLHFKDVFTPAELRGMHLEAPKEFLGIE